MARREANKDLAIALLCASLSGTFLLIDDGFIGRLRYFNIAMLAVSTAFALAEIVKVLRK